MIEKVYKTAIVHDLMLAMGGAEHTLEAIYRVCPSPIFTLLLNKNGVKGSVLDKAVIATSFIQRLPWVLKQYRAYLPFYPIAIEQFDLAGYDVVLSSSFVVAKGAITHTGQLHICYLHNPIRPAWELYQQFLSQSGNGKGVKGFFTRLIFHYLRQWDVVSANRVDYFIANSHYTADRIKKLYRRDARVIYPPVNTDAFELAESRDEYYVTASRLVYHKRIDLIVACFTKMPHKKLIVLGDGPEIGKLKAMATSNVQLLGYQPQQVLAGFLQKAKAFIFAALEDFGIAPIEAMACGTPVLAFGKGGVLETVIEGKTGLFFHEQTSASIADCIERFETGAAVFNPKAIREQATRFNTTRFEHEYREFVREKTGEFYKTESPVNGSSLEIDDLLQRAPIHIEENNSRKQLNGKRLLITGAGGSIGSAIARQVLNCRPGTVILCDFAESPLHELQMVLADNYPDARVKFIIANIRDAAGMKKIFAAYQPQIVVHAAAYKHVPLMEHNPTEAVLDNVIGTKNLADLAVAFHVEKFIMISTDKAINPTTVMGATKRMAELYLQFLHHKGCATKFITTRFGNVLGTSGSVILRFKNQIAAGGPVTVTHPDVTRYFITIAEAAQLVLEAGAMGKAGEILIFDMGEPVNIHDLAKQLIVRSGFVPGRDIQIVFCGLRPGEKLHEDIVKTDEHSLPSPHAKIRISAADHASHAHIDRHISELSLLLDGSDAAIVKKMQEAVPEFCSGITEDV